MLWGGKKFENISVLAISSDEERLGEDSSLTIKEVDFPPAPWVLNNGQRRSPMLQKFWDYLSSEIEKILGSEKVADLWVAARFAESKHAGQVRLDGEPHFY